MVRKLTVVAALAVSLQGAGCTWSPTSSAFSVRSIGSPNYLAPALPTGVYRSVDPNTADLFLTDLPMDRLMDPTDPLKDAVGMVVHVHMFLVPAAGKTPIDPTACNATVRQLVCSHGAIGIYAGGGFLFPNDDPGEASFGGELTDASMRLVRSTADFDDLLGSAIASGTVRASLDEKAALAIAARFEAMARATPEVSQGEHPK